MIEERYNHGMTSDGGSYIYVCGGYKDGQRLRSCERWNSNLNVWTAIARMPQPGRTGLKLVSTTDGAGSRLVVAIGGWGEEGLMIDIIDIYNIATNEWTRSNVTLPTPDHTHSVAVVPMNEFENINA